MPPLVNALLLGLAAGSFGTGLGGVIISLLPELKKGLISFLLAFSAGIMWAVVCFDLLPQAAVGASFFIVFVGVLIGLLALYLGLNFYGQLATENKYLKSGLLLAMGIALHNFPEGLAIGSGYISSAKLGFRLAMVVLVHNLPEGISLAVPLQAGGWGVMKIIAIAFLTGLPMGLGALLGAVLGNISTLFLSLTLSFAAGAMIYIICFELLPLANSEEKKLETRIGLFCGLLFGLFLVLLL